MIYTKKEVIQLRNQLVEKGYIVGIPEKPHEEPVFDAQPEDGGSSIASKSESEAGLDCFNVFALLRMFSHCDCSILVASARKSKHCTIRMLHECAKHLSLKMV